MINDDVLIKYVRNELGHKTDWPNIVNFFKHRLEFIKSGFPGIRSDHLSLVRFKDIKIPFDDIPGAVVPGDVFIYDSMKDDDAPLMLEAFPKYLLILGIGSGMDSVRDPDRIKFRYGDHIDDLDKIGLNRNTFVYRVDVRPKFGIGGPGYYYFYTAYRDQRP